MATQQNYDQDAVN